MIFVTVKILLSDLTFNDRECWIFLTDNQDFDLTNENVILTQLWACPINKRINPE